MNWDTTELTHPPQGAVDVAGESPSDVMEICHNCEEPLAGQPVYFDGEAYCCTGCVNGGPCRCTYVTTGTTGTTRTEQQPVAAPRPDTSTAAHAAAPIAPGDAQHDGAAPDAAAHAMVLRVGTFDDQLDLLRFAGDLEQDPRIDEVSLIRGVDLTDAWFSVRADSAGDLAAALRALARFEILESSILPGGMEAKVRTPLDEEAHADVLPPRQRARIAWADGAPSLRAGSDIRPTPPVSPSGSLEHIAEQTPAASPLASPAPPQEPAVPAEPAPHATPWLQPAYAEPPTAQPAYAEPATTEPTYAAPTDTDTDTEPAPAASQRVIEPPAARFDAPRESAQAPQAPADAVRLVGVDERPGGAVALTEHVTLVVYPFRSFGALNDFQAAVRGLRGVKSDRVRRFYKGTLHLAVEYEDVIPLVQRLHDLTAFPWELVSESRTELELRLESGRAFAAGESDR